MSFCDTLGEAGNSEVPSPVPTIGGSTYIDWRLPTQKELYFLSVAGIRGLNQTTTMRKNFGAIDTWPFWSSSASSPSPSGGGWLIDLKNGGGIGAVKSNTRSVLCVR
jgi:hypothetical protein